MNVVRKMALLVRGIFLVAVRGWMSSHAANGRLLWVVVGGASCTLTPCLYTYACMYARACVCVLCVYVCVYVFCTLYRCVYACISIFIYFLNIYIIYIFNLFIQLSFYCI